MDFVRFFIHDNCEVLCTWCLRYNICGTWFLDIRISTDFCRPNCFYTMIVYTNVCVSNPL